MARKRVKRTESAPAEDIFAALARQGRDMGGLAETTKSVKGAETTDSQALFDRLDALEATNQDLQRRLLLAPAAAPPQQQQTALTARDVPLKFDDLLERDPVSGVTYVKDAGALATRITSYMEAREHATREDLSAEQQAAQNNQTIADRLWAGFIAKYPGWEGHQDIVEMVSTKVAAEAKARGTDVNRYIVGHSDLFYADVAAALQAQYGKLLEEGDDDGENEADDNTPEHLAVGRPDRDRTAGDGGLDDGRTAGIFGGTDSGGAPARRKGGAPVEPAGDEMVKDLQTVQVKLGLY